MKESNRYSYRYLDLRRKKTKEIFFLKNLFIYNLRSFFFKNKFLEIETPILSQHSPEGEGASSFKVLSFFRDRFYTLPQSPQIFKQLLMIGGIGRYYQIAKCFRKENSRSNRQIEFSQIDLEKSFTSSKDIIKFTEKMLLYCLNKSFPQVLNKNITFEKISYKDCINFYGSDKPDLRNPLRISYLKENFYKIT